MIKPSSLVMALTRKVLCKRWVMIGSDSATTHVVLGMMLLAKVLQVNKIMLLLLG